MLLCHHESLSYPLLATWHFAPTSLGYPGALKTLLRTSSQDHASPYFVACFDSGFQETQRGELRLIDENPEFFEVFLEYCRKGKATYKPVDRPEVLRPRKRVQLESCIEFIKFCDRYDLGQALEAIEGTLKKLFKDGASKHLDVASASHLATFLDKDGPIFRLVMLACVSRDLKGWTDQHQVRRAPGGR